MIKKTKGQLLKCQIYAVMLAHVAVLCRYLHIELLSALLANANFYGGT